MPEHPPQSRKGAEVTQRKPLKTMRFLCPAGFASRHVFFAPLRLCGGFLIFSQPLSLTAGNFVDRTITSKFFILLVCGSVQARKNTLDMLILFPHQANQSADGISAILPEMPMNRRSSGHALAIRMNTGCQGIVLQIANRRALQRDFGWWMSSAWQSPVQALLASTGGNQHRVFNA
ncbi:hypothetical protein [Propionivibrio sp.]|uniref:hypothetical protein n=1 Tax=Propionivibrio sp. TaxID=2212460 RepID=UPI003BF45C6A